MTRLGTNLWSTRLLATLCFGILFSALLHPEQGYCGRKGKITTESEALIEDTDDNEIDEGGPPPYSQGTTHESYLEIDGIQYLVFDSQELAPVSMKSEDAGKQFLDISYDDIDAKTFPPGSYIKTPIQFSQADHNLKKTDHYTAEIWLFPNGAGSAEKRGRILVTLQNLNRYVESQNSGAKVPTRFTSGLLKSTETESSSFYSTLTFVHKKKKKTKAFSFGLVGCEHSFVDIGSSGDWNKFKDEWDQNTLRLAITPSAFLKRDLLVTPENGYAFTYEVPYDALLHTRGADGTPTPEAKACNGAGSSWIEIDGEIFGLALTNQKSKLTTHIYTPDSYATIASLRDLYPQQGTTQPSFHQKKHIETQVVKENKKRFFYFMKARDIQIFWHPPVGERVLIGHFGDWRHWLWEHSNYSSTLSYSSDMSYEHFFSLLDGRNATFSISVTKAKDPNPKSERYHKFDSSHDPVQPMPAMIQNFQQLHLPHGSGHSRAIGKTQ
ncbi:hypothetical protein [Parendozoicomonas haliclonae]|uniref:Uncharacterized protein n=1 Tax=Parendozoicomonas haliclonae TaxID=1960125 RepID=A0A1X7AQQ4_9GAMM|nr:hypothetical protein [Parendozoicomonas haliclonae]SMA50420.1 hypothetical protein EHSB41UT_04218 [Parendozoicomonas haliclonae]